MSQASSPLVTIRARPSGPRCPFGNELVEFSLRPGGCVCLSGNSGLGKTTLATVLTGLTEASTLKKLQMEVECTWDPSIPERERCGVLFQQTTLLDELTIAGNLAVALKLHHDVFRSEKERDFRIKELLEAVGLEYARDASKRPTELSGGMARRASLALQLAQHKRVIVLDEPFTGLDLANATSVAKELVRLRCRRRPNESPTALLLISHEPHLTKVVMDPDQTTDNLTVQLVEPKQPNLHSSHASSKAPPKPSLYGTTFWDRFLDRLVDYTLWSLPLILLAFVACGLAIGMLSADLLQRLEINDKVLELIDKEVRPLIKLLTGEEANAFQMMGIRFKVNGMLNKTVPPAKATLYAIGLTKLFVLEIGPLLTALLLCGRIGGSYAGKVGTLQATSQAKLLQTLGVSPIWWTLYPSLLAAMIAGPLLTALGTATAVSLGGWVGPTRYGIGTTAQFYDDWKDALFPVLRLSSWAPLWAEFHGDNDSENMHSYTLLDALTNFDCSVTYQRSAPIQSWAPPSWVEPIVEITTYPPVYHWVKATTFVFIIMTVAECVARYWQPNLTPRGVPVVITISVVSSGLLVILADWAFSQLWLLRY